MNLNLHGKTALVCGASQGIGAAIAHALAEQGCSVIALARTENKLQALLASLNPKTEKPHSYIVCDTSDLKNLRATVDEKIKSYQGIEILVNNSGGPKPGKISEATEEEFNNAFQTHLQANSLLVKLLLPGMKKAHYGRIINILSTSIKILIPEIGISNTIRWAVAAWAKTLSMEVAPFGITVNNILPGYIETERFNTLAANLAQLKNVSIEEIKNIWLNSIPAKRFGTAQEIADAVVFLASPAAAYINGIALTIDGGRTGSL